VLRANAVFRAVALPAGSHEVRFCYAPRLLRVCAGVSVVSLLVIVVLLVVPEAAPAPGPPASSERRAA